jgi:hypothetical protein
VWCADDFDGQVVTARRGADHVERRFRGGARSRDTDLCAQPTRLDPVADVDAETVQGAEDLRVTPEQPDDEGTEENEGHGFDHEQGSHVALRAVLGSAVIARYAR